MILGLSRWHSYTGSDRPYKTYVRVQFGRFVWLVLASPRGLTILRPAQPRSGDRQGREAPTRDSRALAGLVPPHEPRPASP